MTKVLGLVNGEKCIMRNFLAKYYSVDCMKEDKIGSAYSTYGEKGNASRVLVGKTAEKEDSEDLDVDDSIILKWIGGQRATPDYLKKRQVL